MGGLGRFRGDFSAPFRTSIKSLPDKGYLPLFSSRFEGFWLRRMLFRASLARLSGAWYNLWRLGQSAPKVATKGATKAECPSGPHRATRIREMLVDSFARRRERVAGIARHPVSGAALADCAACGASSSMARGKRRRHRQTGETRRATMYAKKLARVSRRKTAASDELPWWARISRGRRV